MATPDLPVEIWLEILAYLPRSALHKMLSINRLLFELALNDIYEEIRLVDDDEEMVKVLKQLRSPSIAERVKRLYIRPAFLPGMDESNEGSSAEPSGPSSLEAGFNFLKSLSISRKLRSTIPVPAERIFHLASTAIKKCINLRHLTVVVHDHALTPLFMDFLDSLYHSDSLGPKLTQLSIDTTALKLPSLLKPLIKRVSSLTSLEEFEFSLVDSRFSQTNADYAASYKTLKTFFETFSKTLITVSVSTLVPRDLKPLFTAFPLGKPFRRLQLCAIFNSATLPTPHELTTFLFNQASGLENLTLSAHPRQTSFHSSGYEYADWLLKSSTPTTVEFGSLKFPNLRSLNIELPTVPHRRNAPLPPLVDIAPNITTLILTHHYLTFEHLTEIMDNLPTFEPQKIKLQRFEFRLLSLCPQTFDVLAQKAPRLLELSIEYLRSSADISGSEVRLWDQGKTLNDFRELMQPRRYPNWGLSKLRLACLQSNSHAHPVPSFMEAVASTLPKAILMDVDYYCECSFSQHRTPYIM
ncbi:hypothetical protein CPB83DRAFT_693934 [Crepidotus variabilis]|uniref:F-box domain-containing protein n=1 Tax=Crepidotus variabilis TaxID=179855 RepID=A0A9P6E6A5_9AGAR|nr:hypothetical protein CPB83DRAFT_693934 [Crepidotus variabilis]